MKLWSILTLLISFLRTVEPACCQFWNSPGRDGSGKELNYEIETWNTNGSSYVWVQVPDFTPFFQRVKDQKPDCLFVFIPSGSHALAVVKTYGQLGLRQAGIKLVSADVVSFSIDGLASGVA